MKNSQNRSPGRPRSSEQELPTKEIILKASARLFLDNSFQNVSVDEVASVCNVTKATVYYYYDSKAELFTETMVQMMERIRERMHAILQERIPLHDRLLNITKAHLKATFDIDMEGLMKGTRNALSDKQINRMHKAKEKMYQAIEEAFSDAIAEGEIPQINTTFAAHAYLSLLKVGNYKTADKQPIFKSVDDSAEQIVQFLWQGLFSNQQHADINKTLNGE